VVVAPSSEILARPDHPWFAPGAAPVVLGIGRLVAQKNFPLLIRAFAAVRQQTQARLVILGGDESSNDQVTHRRELLGLIDELGLNEDVALIGFQSNPHVYLRTARVFVLSSLFEGFGNVVVEALLAGCPVVSTDCPSGPAEILEQGRYGILVPIEDPRAMAQAILESLGTEHDREKLRERGAEFSLERAVAGYHRAFFGELPACSGAASADGASVRPTS
jgi:glycosyltransferase involved in cell wall biosynthesis